MAFTDYFHRTYGVKYAGVAMSELQKRSVGGSWKLLRPNCFFIHSSEGPPKRILQFVEPPLIAIVLDMDLFEAGRFSVNLVGQYLVRRELLGSCRFLILHVEGFENLAY